MIVEMGHMALVLALVSTLATSVLGFAGARGQHDLLLRIVPQLAMLQFVLVLMAFASLTWAYVTSDFSVLNVALNSHTQKPMMYKISGVWGNHEGSLLFWALVLTLYGAAVAVFGRALPSDFRARVLAVQALIVLGFLLFMLLTSNPFARVDVPPIEGNGLNPLLQDPALVFHPPLLYLGYVGFSVAFSFSMAALLSGEVTKTWASWVRPWTLLAWGALTAGIALGSWWAYYELGWGGWWFWDPVENASLMPWLAGTALLHSVIVVEKRDALKSWTILLAIMAFSLSLIGTFLVRSGVVTSVHAFANDPERGMFILGFLVFVIGGSLSLFALRADRLVPGGKFSAMSREGSLVFNNLFMVTALLTVMLGTLYPLFVDALFAQKLSVGPPYFEATFVPLFVPVLLAMVLGPVLAWKRANLWDVLRQMKYVMAVAIVAGLVALWVDGDARLMPAMGILLGAWLVAGTVWAFATRVGLFAKSANSWARVKGLPRGVWGMTIAHFGVGVLVLGIAISSSWSRETLANMRIGDQVNVDQYVVTLEGLDPVSGPNYSAVRARFNVLTPDGRHIILEPEERTFWAPPTQTTEVAIRSLWSGDLYAVIGNETEGGRWSARLYFRPMITWIWLGALLMMMGAFVSATDRAGRQEQEANDA